MTFGFALMAIGSILMLSGYEKKTIGEVLSQLQTKPQGGETAFSAYLKTGGAAVNAAFTGSGSGSGMESVGSTVGTKGTLTSSQLAGHPACLKPGIDALVATILQHWPKLIVTATCDGTHATDSYHYKGRAVDLSSSDYAYMNEAAAWIKSHMTPLLTEGIHNPNLSVKYHAPVPSSYWGSETWAGHANHIHVAV